MAHLLPYVIAGIALGSPYALAGVGLVLTYRTSKIFNFSQGGLATVAAWLFYVLHDEHNVPWPIAAAISGIALGIAMGIAFESFGRRLSWVSSAMQIAATIGILVSIETLVIIIFGPSQRQFPHFLPTSGFHIDGVAVSYEQLIITLVSIVATGGLYVVLHHTHLGKAMRAVVDDPDLLGMTGTDPTRVRRWAWIIGCTFATVSGLLLAPSVALDSITLTLLIVQAFGAAAIGGFYSLPLTWLGGMLIGVGSSILSQYGAPGSILAGLSPSLPFIILFLVLLFYPKRRLAPDLTTALIRPPLSPRLPNRWQWRIGAVVLLGFLLVPLFTGYQVDQWTIILTYVLLFLSLGLLVRTAGQVSLCQLGFAAIGAASFGHLLGDGIPWFFALLLSCVVVIPIGAILSIPAVRLSGLYLALATLGFGIMLQDVFYYTPIMFGSTEMGVQVRPPSVSWIDVSSDTGYYYLVLLIVAIVVALMVALDRSRMGRLLRGISDSPRALAVGGTSITVTYVIVFCIAAAIAALAGALVGPVYQTVTGSNFDPFNSLVYLAIIIIAVGGAPWYAIPPAIALVAIPLYWPYPLVPYYLQLSFGVAAVLVAIRGPQQFPRLLRLMGVGGKSRTGRFSLRGKRKVGDQARVGEVDHSVGATALVAHSSLVVSSLTVQYGGVVAVKKMNFEAPPGRVTALIGPNGAGKSTLLNACSGFVRPSEGKITFADVDISNLSIAARARLGIGRTFQRMDLFESLTVFENVGLGREASMAGNRPRAQLLAKRRDTAEIRHSAEKAIELCGLGELAGEQIASLSTGNRRLVELARALAGPFEMLLLDEPSSGLDRPETQRVMEILRDVVAERGIGVVLVEHDMDMVMSIAHEIFVMDFGELLFRGSPAEVQQHEGVIAAYLGPGSDLATSVSQT